MRHERPAVRLRAVTSAVRCTVYRVWRELSALHAFYLFELTVPGPPEVLRPWLFELLTRWAARLQSCRIIKVSDTLCSFLRDVVPGSMPLI